MVKDTEDAIEKEKIEEKKNKYKALSPAVRKKFFDALSSHSFICRIFGNCSCIVIAVRITYISTPKIQTIFHII